MSLKEIVLASFFTLFPMIGCGNSYLLPKMQKAKVCSYEKVEETVETIDKKKSRLGNTLEQYGEVIPGHNDVNEKRINLVFIGVNYTEEEFLDEVKTAVDCDACNNGLFSKEPFKSNADAFNIWYVKEIANIEEGKYETGWEHSGDEAEDAIDEINEKCDMKRKVPIAFINWHFRSEASPSNIRYLNLDKYNLKNIAKIQDEFSESSNSSCDTAALSCHYLDFNESGIVDYKDLDILKEEDISENILGQICLYYFEDDCYEALTKNDKITLDEYVAKFSSEMSQNKSFDFCNAIGEITGTTKFDTEVCDLITDDIKINFWRAKVSEGDPATLVHELGHSLFGLRDEYLEEDTFDEEDGKELTQEKINNKKIKHLNKITKNGVNCFVAETKEDCEMSAPWSDMIEDGKAGCFKGCAYFKEIDGKGLWRSVEKGIMKSSKSKEFGAWDEAWACKVIYLLTNKADGVCLDYLDFLKD